MGVFIVYFWCNLDIVALFGLVRQKRFNNHQFPTTKNPSSPVHLGWQRILSLVEHHAFS